MLPALCLSTSVPRQKLLYTLYPGPEEGLVHTDYIYMHACVHFYPKLDTSVHNGFFVKWISDDRVETAGKAIRYTNTSPHYTKVKTMLVCFLARAHASIQKIIASMWTNQIVICWSADIDSNDILMHGAALFLSWVFSKRFHSTPGCLLVYWLVVKKYFDTCTHHTSTVLLITAYSRAIIPKLHCYPYTLLHILITCSDMIYRQSWS